MNDTKLCTCGGEMVSGGKQYIGISDTILFSGSILNCMPVEIFTCKKCRKMEFYSMSAATDVPDSSAEERFYSMYKDASNVKLRKILDKDDYTEQCKAVVRKILHDRECGKDY